MKNLKTGNYTEFRDVSDGLHLRRGELNMTNLGYAKVPKSRKRDVKSEWFHHPFLFIFCNKIN